MSLSDSGKLLSIMNPDDKNTLKHILLVLFVYGITVLPIFVIYLKVYKLNKSRDQESAVFQIIDHFHVINKYLTTVFWCLMSLGILFYFYEHEYITVLLIISSVVLCSCVAEVNQFLLGLLAIQRSFIYFYPSTEKYLNFSKRTMKWILIIAYSISVLEFILLYKSNTEKEDLSISYVYNGSIQVFLTASALLYIPIVISITKLTNLASAKINKPQIFVALQLVIVVAKQMVFLTIALIFEITTEANESVDSKYTSFYWAFWDSKVIDTILIPTITQITYLGCNRRNVMTLWKSLKPKWLFRSSRRIDSDVRVQYGVRIEMTL